MIVMRQPCSRGTIKILYQTDLVVLFNGFG